MSKAKTELLAAAEDGAPAAPSDDLVEQVAAELHQLEDASALDFALKAGKLLLDRFYEGDIDVMRSRDPKEHSLRTLAARPDVRHAANTLSRYIAVYGLTERLGGVPAREHLTMTHYRTVLPLDDEDRERLLTQAAQEKWTTRKLEQEAAKLKPKKGAGGRPALPLAVKGLNAIARSYVRHEGSLSNLNELDGLAPSDAKELLQTVEKLEARLPALKQRLDTLAKAPFEAAADKKAGKKRGKGSEGKGRSR